MTPELYPNQNEDDDEEEDEEGEDDKKEKQTHDPHERSQKGRLQTYNILESEYDDYNFKQMAGYQEESMERQEEEMY